MSISSHLTPEPEKRLWAILAAMEQSVEWTDKKIAALTALAAAQIAFANIPSGPLGFLASLSLSAAIPLGVFAFSPLTGAPKWLPFLEPRKGKPTPDDCLIIADDIVKYTHSELILRLDKYLGGGITATLYYEDLVSQILYRARLATRKRRLFKALCLLVGAAQLALLFRR